MDIVQKPWIEAVYKTAVSDNSRWAGFAPRAGDIFVCTPPKCGTTWTQTIVAALLWPADDAPASVWQLSPWLDAQFAPIDEVLAGLEAQPHRRFIKTHTPPEGFPRFEDCKYIAVFRDGRDAFMSTINHTETFRPDVRAALNARATEEGVPLMPEWNGDGHEIFDWWLGVGLLFLHLAQWWPMRHDPNVLLVHYNDLKADLEGEMRRIAGFLDIDVPEAAWPAVVERCTFAAMRERSDAIAEFGELFQGGGESFLHKGTNGRWHDFLTPEELARYDAKVAELVPAGAVDWLTAGSLAVGVRPEKIG